MIEQDKEVWVLISQYGFPEMINISSDYKLDYYVVYNDPINGQIWETSNIQDNASDLLRKLLFDGGDFIKGPVTVKQATELVKKKQPIKFEFVEVEE